jgi:hypothetical protein
MRLWTCTFPRTIWWVSIVSSSATTGMIISFSGREAVAAVVLRDERVGRHDAAGAVLELYDELSCRGVGDDRAGRSIIADNQGSLHDAPPLLYVRRRDARVSQTSRLANLELRSSECYYT